MILYRRAKSSDYPGILVLREKFSLDKLPEKDRQHGFLSGQMDLLELERINNALGMLVAIDHNQVIGFLGLDAFDAPITSPVVGAMHKAILRLQLHGKPLAKQPIFIFGPVCIAATHQGQGIFKGLYHFMWTHLDPNQYSIGLAFVAKDNPHSLSAHCKGLGAKLLGSFTCRRHPFWLIALTRP